MAEIFGHLSSTLKWRFVADVANVLWSILRLCSVKEKDGSELWQMKMEGFNLVRGTKVSETSGCLTQLFTENEDETSLVCNRIDMSIR